LGLTIAGSSASNVIIYPATDVGLFFTDRTVWYGILCIQTGNEKNEARRTEAEEAAATS